MTAVVPLRQRPAPPVARLDYDAPPPAIPGDRVLVQSIDGQFRAVVVDVGPRGGEWLVRPDGAAGVYAVPPAAVLRNFEIQPERPRGGDAA